MNIQEEREYILTENNTAQQRFNDIVGSLSASSTGEINIDEPLSGELDLSVLDSLGFKKIKRIHLGEGKLTDITHIPKIVTHFTCAHNLLVALNYLPESLVELNCSHNSIIELAFQDLSRLERLNCSHNKLSELTKIPESIVDFDCDNNEITRLNLANLIALKVLHCANNKLMVLENVPAELRELRMENNPMAEIYHNATNTGQHSSQGKEIEVKMDFIEGLNEYFRLKCKYEVKEKAMKTTAFKNAPNRKIGKLKASSVKAPCVNCKRAVGTVFAKKDNKYIALCGDKSAPCNLNIQIFNGYVDNQYYSLITLKEFLDGSKEDIIIQKLDTLFNYVSKQKVADHLFKQQLEKYTENSELYKLSLDNYNQIHNNMHRRELIVRKNEEIYEVMGDIRTILAEYAKTSDAEILKTAVQMQIDDLIPKIEHLRRLKYEVMEMYTPPIDESAAIEHLIQRETILAKGMDYTYSEPGHIIKFSRK